MTDERVEISVTLPSEFADKLVENYPVAARPSQAIRIAVQNDVERQRERVTPTSIREAIVEALGVGEMGVDRVSVATIDGMSVESIADLDVDAVEDLDVGSSGADSAYDSGGDSDTNTE